MTTTTGTAPETRSFEADVARLLHMMVHSVYSDKDVFLRELISNAADACEKLRYELLSDPALAGDDGQPRITVTLDPEARQLIVEDNGIGMSEVELAEALGTIARSGTRAFMERVAAVREGAKEGEGAQLIGQFGVGFYSAFMVADRVDVFSRRAGADVAAHWASDGLGSYTIQLVDIADAPARGTRIVLHLKEDAASYTEPFTAQRIVTAQSGHVPVPIFLKEKPDAEEKQIADGAALWTRPRSDITAEEYADFYRSTAGQFDEPALTLHYRAEGLHEYSVLAFLPSMRPFDLFDPDRAGRMKLYVRRVFITDEAQILPRYLRFVRGLVDSNDLPLNVSREMIQESPVLAAVQKGVANRILSELDKLAQKDGEAYLKFWDNFGAVLKEGLYEDFARREALLGLARFKSTASGEGWRSLKDYVEAIKDNQTAIYYATGADLDRLASSPQLEGFRARGIEVLLLTDQVDSFWVTAGVDYQGKPFKSVTQGLADLSLIPLAEGETPAAEASAEVDGFIAYARDVLGEAVSDVRASERLTESAVCLVAPDNAMDRQLEKLLAGAGRIDNAARPVLEINPRHDLIVKLGTLPDGSDLREDAAWLLLDEARIADGELPADPRAFSARLARMIGGAIE
ncbi:MULTISPECIES: molecular chaperone HtpG [Sphingobium]|uniref:Chaperone protein HtpG n=1 Tax=Sphingobium fuliginis (strain ATCC 27551) TaxID=336203 RepID=A0ABQ1ENQ0_SPHSA|nr:MULTISPECIES: molecular chaperone HtpG [Sphingobium]AJR22432.1 heat shock protein 90 [Sphingobium sp. YBL2]RYM00809.1 molecular chaperone HtpG [Sphingobium fuliginis]UXC89407.1 molecular chaperone HtpG [Sphingobium sp. RSMS]WDA38294.1 molecular chaperone HtpG [Sphingobium sp. YC-XJ3]GFZ80245.1 chaperone protein HtpG [Sphingobium fuliginis]